MTSSSRLGKCRFGNYRVAFKEYRAGIKAGERSSNHIPRQKLEYLVLPCRTELHLGGVASFVDCQMPSPRDWSRGICVHRGVDIHPSRSPCNRSVGHRVQAVEYDGHPGLVAAAGFQAGRPTQRIPGALELVGIYPCEGIGADRIDYLEIISSDTPPPQACRVASFNGKLGVQGGAGKCQQNNGDRSFHIHARRY